MSGRTAPAVQASRSAFIIANDDYADERLRRLRAPAADARELAEVLGDPDVGGFDVEVSQNEPEHVVRRRLSAFFDNRSVEDLLLLHLSCHGVKDEDGRLYFATPDTEMDHLEATSLPSEFVNRQMTRSRSRRVVLLLDCCYSGAFARGWTSRAGDRVDIPERFDGRGRIVLTASSAMEYSFEGDELSGEGRPSVFTSALVRGLSTGEADRNRDGHISVDELYDFAYDQVRAVTPSQTPGKWVFDVQGDFNLARSPHRPEPAGVPAELVTAARSPFAQVRAGAVEELEGLLRAPDAVLVARARELLAELAQDDSQRVARAALRALGRDDGRGSGADDAEGGRRDEVADRAPPAPARTAPPVVAEPVAPARAPLTARVGAAALLAVLVITAMAFGAGVPADGWNLFAVLSPIEALLVAAAGWRLADALAGGRIRTSVGAGTLTALGALSLVGSFGLLKFSAERIGALALVLSVVAAAGSALLLASGLGCLRAARRTAQPARIDPAALMLGLGGSGLAFASLFITYDGFSSLATEVSERESAEFFLVPALAVLLALVGVSALGWWPGFGSGTLAATGGLLVAHYVGVLLAAAFAVGEVGEVGLAGFVGLFAGLLVAGAGLYPGGRAESSA